MRNEVIAGWRAIACLMAIAVGITGCGGGGGDLPTANANGPDPSAPEPAGLRLSGSPATSVMVGAAYSFAPTATATAGTQLTYSVQNKPAWAAFDASTGALTGTPEASNVGTYAGIVISVSDGATSTALTAFQITVTEVANGTATVGWNIPTMNSDGSPLANLAGFRIYYGTSADSLNRSAQVANSGVTSFVISNLAAAKWYFAVKAYTAAGVESALSNIASKTIT